MKKILGTLVLSLAAMSSFAEATFEQIEGLIQQKNYAAAASGLEVIVQNHPKSAKAFYAMAQAQAGLGNLEKANKALNIATGLNPTLDFAPASSVASLKQAITPQTAKIEVIEESHFWRNTLAVLFALTIFGGIYMLWRKKEDEEEAKREQALAELKAERDRERKEREERLEARAAQARAEVEAEEAKEAALRAHKNYGHERFDPANPDKLKSVKQFKTEQQEAARVMAQAEADREARMERLRQQELEARLTRSNAVSGPAYAQPTHTTVVNNSGNDMLTGILVGNMLSGSHHDTTRVVEREVIREVPATPSRSSSWDDTPSTPSRSSSWDDTPSRSSSWSDSSSSSSSSDSSSSSSWD
jgi:hypothetical protein